MIGSFGDQDRVLVLSLPVDVVDVVGPVVRVVYPLPPEGQLVLLAVLGSLLLYPGQSRVQPVRGPCNKKQLKIYFASTDFWFPLLLPSKTPKTM